MEKAICKSCNKEFSYYRSTLRGNDAQYCSHKCQKPWNKGKITYKECLGCKKTIRQYRKYCSPNCYYSHNDISARLPKDVSGNKNPMFGKHLLGNKSGGWRGGITPINTKIRMSKDYILWRTAVFTRDEFTCVSCHEKGGVLNADHIKPFSLYPELRFAIDNGRTLCRDCHLKTDTWGGRVYKTVERIIG